MVTHPPSLPFDVRRLPVKRHKRRRGQRGGIRQRLRCRRNSASLPGIILSNIRSLQNEIEELRVKTKVCFEYREADLLVLTETWLHSDLADSQFEVDGFALVRADR